MDSTDELRAEHVGEVGGNCGEAAAVHRQDDRDAGDEQRHAANRPGERDEGVKHGAEREEDDVGPLATEDVGQRRPEDPAGDVEQAQKADEARRRGRRHCPFEDLLDHR